MNGIAFKRFLKHGDIQSVLSEELGELEFELKNLPYGENMKADGYKAKIEEKKQQMNTNYNVNYVPYSNAQYILNKIQRHKLIDSDIFAILVNNPSILLRRVAAENIASDSPESLIDLLLLENDKTINYYIASNKFAPISVLIKLARTEDEEILVNLVDRESLEDEVIKEVLKINHSSKTVLNKLRNNPKAKSCLTKIDSEIAKLSN